MTRLSRSMTPELSIVIPVRNESPNIKRALRRADGRAGPVRPQLRADHRRRREHGRHVRAAGRAPGRAIRGCASSASGATSARPRRSPPAFAYARGRLVVHLRRRPAERSARHPAHGRPHRGRATTSSAAGARTGRTRSSRARVPSMIANKLISWATGVDAARLRLLAEGVPRRGHQAAPALRRDAPVPAGDREPDRRVRSTRWW